MGPMWFGRGQDPFRRRANTSALGQRGKQAMPLLDHFHPPLHGPRRWEGFHHSWATFIAKQLNEESLPPGYFAESEISLGPELEIDVANMELTSDESEPRKGGTAVWCPPQPKLTAKV